MSVEQSIERISQDHEAVMWWEPDERAIVFAGSEVEDAVVATNYSESEAKNLGNKSSMFFYGYQMELLEEMEEDREKKLFGREPRPIGILAGSGFVRGNVALSAMEWLGNPENTAWAGLAINALRTVRSVYEKDKLGIVNEEALKEFSGVFGLDISGVPGDKKLFVPNLVVDSLTCSCLGPDGSDRDWSKISWKGSIELYQHNVDHYKDSLPIAAGLAAINSKILGVESSQQTLF